MGLNNDTKKVLLLLLVVSLIGISVFFYYNAGTYKYVGSIDGWPIYWYFPQKASVVMSMLIFFLGLFIFILSLKPSYKSMKISILFTILLLVASLLVAKIFYIGFNPSKVLLELPTRTDSYLIQVEAAKSIIKGLNPYEQNYKAALLNGLEPTMYTWIYSSNTPPYTINRIVGFVHVFDYFPPAALWYVPAVALRIPGNVWDAIAISVAFTLIYIRMRKMFKVLFPAILVTSMFIYLSQPILQNPLAGWLVPTLLAIAFPDRPLLAGISLAWASLYRPYVGVFALFYLIAAYYEGYNIKRMLASAIATGVLLTVPFFILNPHVFIERIILPLISNFRPMDAGPGLTSLEYLGIYIPKAIHTILVIGITLVGLVVAYKFYHKLKYAIFLFPILAMYCYYRPSYAYYLYFPLMILLAYTTGFFRSISRDLNQSINQSAYASIASKHISIWRYTSHYVRYSYV
ncbi:MAG: hypothetical protein G5Z43_000325 [Caldisphaeraceae archaeon]|nr:hypothetical protein [Caldisphaeraceae archaeon]